MAHQLRFRRQIIDENPPGSYLDITLIADVNGDGRPDIIIGGKSGDANLFWYENPSWRRHIIAVAPGLEAGGVCLDITGNGLPDIVAGMQQDGNELYWFENPGDPQARWTKYVIEDRFLKYHDQAAGDIDGDGRPEILFASQQSGVIAYFTLPDDPFTSPWPRRNCHIIAENMPDVEGLAVCDIDGDGRAEVLAGPNIFKRRGREWRRTCFAPDFMKTRLAVQDLDGDGQPEIVLSEGEQEGARLAVCHAPDWTPRVLMDDLSHPHSLEIADFNADGRPDIFTAEMGLHKNEIPRTFVFINQGDGRFVPQIVHEGIPLHEAKAADLNGDGLPDIVGKPYAAGGPVSVWFNETGVG